MVSLPYFKAPKPFLLAILVSTPVWTSPTPGPGRTATLSRSGGVKWDLVPRTVTTLSSEDISSYTPFTQFARAAYCDPAIIENWTCGGACDANPGFQTTLTGGDGADIPHFFVGYWSAQNAAVVSHEGTDPSQFLSLLIDADINKASLDASLFPGVPSDAQVHQGFRDSHQATASIILSELNNLIGSKGTTSVIVVGHSLGGAIAELDTLFLRLNLPSSISVRGVTYGTPRVGVPAFADYFDSKVDNFRRINHALDPIPIVPGRELGFSHVAGEIHIIGPDQWNSCSGDDDTEPGCTISEVPNVFASDITDHLGPYQGEWIGTNFCN
ncbi:alpha/beta-hydrolase [Thelephora terrestris]|uniref:Alpha/beta-hydrolase n=1 Tax=Thelephora terrestris TaxID=56493 RepID=A0A9P6HGJ8_9AGAM|nr:alpha/beta-hydrolase [Thelephora terrestris]